MMVEGKAFQLYLSTIASKLSKSLAENSHIRAIQRHAGECGAEGHGAERPGAEDQDVEKRNTEDQDIKE